MRASQYASYGLVPAAQTFALEQIAEAHRLSESGDARGKLVLLVG